MFFQVLLTAIHSKWFICQTVSERLKARRRCNCVISAAFRLALSLWSTPTKARLWKSQGHCYRNNQPVIEVVLSFLYCGRFVDYKITFDTQATEEPDYLAHLESDADVGVLQSKEWFDWKDMLLAGTSLIFCIQSQISFKDKTTYRNVSVSGDIFVRNQLKVLAKVRSVDFQPDNSQGNPVLAYQLQ